MNIYLILIINSFLSAIGSALGMTIFELYIRPGLNKIREVKKNGKNV